MLLAHHPLFAFARSKHQRRNPRARAQEEHKRGTRRTNERIALVVGTTRGRLAGRWRRMSLRKSAHWRCSVVRSNVPERRVKFSMMTETKSVRMKTAPTRL